MTNFHTSTVTLQDLKKDVFKDLEDKSKIEEFVEHQQKKVEQQEKDLKSNALNEPKMQVMEQSLDTNMDAKKPTIMERIKHELTHYYNGFRLLYLDMKIAARLLWQVMNGKALSRRERKQVSIFYSIFLL